MRGRSWGEITKGFLGEPGYEREEKSLERVGQDDGGVRLLVRLSHSRA
jgi:hypothetical protein